MSAYSPGLSMKSTVQLIVLTAVYLLFELGFNARLLDVVGGGASADQVHRIETYGRLLSGIAAALVVLQLLMLRRARTGSPAIIGIAFWCLVTVGLVYGGLQLFVDTLVARSTAEFRRQSLNVVLVQQALVKGSAQLDGLDDEDPALFGRPEGKAFLALFPVLASSVERLEEKVGDAKLVLLEQQIGRELHGPKGVFEKYDAAMGEMRKQWSYYRNGTSPALDAEVRRQQDSAWEDYRNDLARHRWTPSTVPARYRQRVANSVRERVPVPAAWQPDDRRTFYRAVEGRVRDKANAGRDGSIRVRGQRVPPGLAFADFVLHPGVQDDLQVRLGVPASIQIAPQYASAEQFRVQFYDRLRQALARQEIGKYTAPVHTFGPGGLNESLGLDAARAALVPPIALLCSLLGAIGHLGKLLYLCVKAGGMAASAKGGTALRSRLLGAAWILPFLTIGLVWAAFSFMSNNVTRSRLYTYLQAQALHTESGMPNVAAMLATNAMHVVAVGQGYAYPFNEALRVRVLRGVDYGY